VGEEALKRAMSRFPGTSQTVANRLSMPGRAGTIEMEQPLLSMLHGQYLTSIRVIGARTR
jgi:hypothetical protein